MKNKLFIISAIIIIHMGCGKNPSKNNPLKNIRLLSFSAYLESPNPENKNMEVFSGEKIEGSVLSVGKRTRNFTLLPTDEAMLYVIQETMVIDLPLGTQELRPGEAIYLPAGVTFRISAKNDKLESKVLIVRSNTGKLETVTETEK